MLCITVVIYPQMADQMSEVTKAFSDMGAFSNAFGMDKLNFGEFMGYFAVECGNVLGLGGALFAAVAGISALSKEEKNRTSEFLYTQPVPRSRIMTEKLLSVYTQIVILNAAASCAVLASAKLIGVKADFGTMLLMILANFIMQIEIASICFFVSTLAGDGGIAIGIGIAFFFYFLNIIANVTDKAKALKYVTPFGYTDGSDILSKGSLEMKYIAVGAVLSALCIALAFVRYRKKDL